MKISVIGSSGGIGQPLSLLLKMNLPKSFELSLYDISSANLGVGVDLSHIPNEVKVSSYIDGDIGKCLEGCDLVLISAGVARKPNMDRSDLFNINASIIKDIAHKCVAACPDACFGIITNPVNTTVPIFAKVFENHSLLNNKKIFGVTTLDVIRSETIIAKQLNCSPANINIKVIGGHSGTTILPLISQVDNNFSADLISSLTHNIQNAGTEVVNAKSGSGSATLSMAYAAYRFANSLIKALSGEPDIVECAYVAGNSGLAKYFAQPILLGKDGVDKFLPYGNLSNYEQQSVDSMLDVLRDDIFKGENFITN